MAPPSFDSPTYWDHRFQKETQPFDWLLTYTHLQPFLTSAISHFKNPSLLHIGCGTSSLSSHLCDLVPAANICNVDYSPMAIKLGKQRQQGQGLGELSRWRTLDLLDGEQVFGFAKEEGGWDVVVDKSTADAISCGDDVRLSLPLSAGVLEEKMLYPLDVLAIHLAVLTRTGGKWLVCSYSRERFAFWDGEGNAEMDGDGAQWLKQRGLHPGDLWKLESFEGVVKSEESMDGVYRPPEMCYLYTLVRTEVEVEGV